MEWLTEFIRSKMPAKGELEAAHKEHVQMMTKEIALQLGESKTRMQYEGYWKAPQHTIRMDQQIARAEKTPVSTYDRALKDFYSAPEQ